MYRLTNQLNNIRKTRRHNNLTCPKSKEKHILPTVTYTHSQHSIYLLKICKTSIKDKKCISIHINEALW